MVDCSLKSTTVLKRVCLPSDVVGLGTDIVFILNSFNPPTGGWGGTIVGGKVGTVRAEGRAWGRVYTFSSVLLT